MSYRVHTAGATALWVQIDTLDVAAKELGLEIVEGEDLNEKVLILKDFGNQEAFVVRGTEHDIWSFGMRLINLLSAQR